MIARRPSLETPRSEGSRGVPPKRKSSCDLSDVIRAFCLVVVGLLLGASGVSRPRLRKNPTHRERRTAIWAMPRTSKMILKGRGSTNSHGTGIPALIHRLSCFG